MLLDNENDNPKVYQWIEDNTHNGTFDIVTGYFTIGALSFLAEKTNEKISAYRFIIGDIVATNEQPQKSIDLLNENITAEHAFKLKQWAIEAKAFLEQTKVTCKTLEPNFCHAKLYITSNEKNNPMQATYIMGSSNLTEAGIGLKQKKNIELNTAGTGTEDIYKELKKWFNELWEKPQANVYKTIKTPEGKDTKIDFKQYLIDEISKIFENYLPADIYKKVLHELFSTDDDPSFQRDFGKLENSVIYNKLYPFQQIGVASLIKMLNKYDGAILADAVGLGKTWSTLAVIKFYQIKGRETILICPKKLGHNWKQYLRKESSIFETDRFEYEINYHTDFTENNLTNEAKLRMDYLLNDKPKLIVIDESHNLRNSKSIKYKILMEEILQKTKGDIKVLLLSATPINNDFRDVRNQFALMVKGANDGFNQTLAVKNLEHTFRKVQASFNKWNINQGESLSDFYKEVSDNDFFKLTDNLVVTRTRKHIKQHFQSDIHFPKVLKPINKFVTTLQLGDFDDLPDLMEKLKLSLPAYQPSQFTLTLDEIKKRQIEKEEKKNKKDAVLHDSLQREYFLVKMMKILLLKRLESSWFAFQKTVNVIYAHHENVLAKIKQYQELKKDTEVEIDNFDEIENEDLATQLESVTIGKKNPIKLSEIDAAGRLDDYKSAILKDKDNLTIVKSNVDQFETAFNKSHNVDIKLVELFKIISDKQLQHNKKIVIFTAYTDTANYLYQQITKHLTNKTGIVAGDNAFLGIDNSRHDIQQLLQRFAPYTKLYLEKTWKDFHAEKIKENYDQWKQYIATNEPNTSIKLEQEFDILITTDVLSEGQNLQDADMVINYDIHWNPVRVIQRFGRVDRIGSPNERIQCINFWPAKSVDGYIKLRERVEKRMAVMQFIGSEVMEDFTDEFAQKAKNPLKERQDELLIKQLENKLEDLDGEATIGFDDFSFDVYKQQLFQFQQEQVTLNQYPNGIFSGAQVTGAHPYQKGIIALLGRKPKKNEKYLYYYLIYLDQNGNTISDNQKTVLDVLDYFKDNPRFVPQAIDSGDAKALATLSSHIQKYIQNFTAAEQIEDDGTTKQTMGKAGLDTLQQLKKGNKTIIEQIKTEAPLQQQFNKDNFDLITWMVLA